MTANSLLGQWAGSVYVEKGSVLTTSYSNQLKNTESTAAANIYIDGTFNLTGSNNLNFNDGNAYQNWHIGEEGIINITNSNGNVTKGTKTWNLEFVVNDVARSYEKEVIGRGSIGPVQRTKTVLTSNNGIALTNVDTYRIINKDNVLLGDKTTTEQANAAKLRLDGKNWVVDYFVQGYTAATLTWNGGNNGVWEDLDTGWTLNGESATFISNNGDSAVFGANGYDTVLIDSTIIAHDVTVKDKAYTFNTTGGSLTANALTVESSLSITGGAVTAGTLTVGDGATLSLSTGSNLSVTGDVTLTGSTGITVGTGATLKLHNAASAAQLLQTVTGTGNITLATNVELEGADSKAAAPKSKATGTLTLDHSTLKLGKMGTGGAFVDKYVDLSSFSHIKLDNATLWVHAAPMTINGVTVENGTSNIHIQDTSSKDKLYLTLGGTTTVNANSTLKFLGTWKGQTSIATLSGEGTLDLAGPGGNSIYNIGGGSIGKLQISTNVVSNIAGDLTLGGLAGTTGTVNAAQNLTFTGSGTYSYTGTLTVGGQVVKTGAGTQTLGGFAVNKTIDVQAGTLVLNGTYDITNLEMDPGVTYTYQNEQGQVSPDSVGGFRATNGSKTVYTKGGSAIVTDSSATYMLGGKQVQLTDGKYAFAPEADLSTLWVNGGTLSYDAYYAASGETPALTTAKVAGGATLAIGEHAVGTLAYQTDGSTINLSGTGTVNAISGTGTLNLENGAVATLGYNPVIASGQTLTTTGAGALEVTTLENNGGTMNLGSHIKVTGGGQGTGNDPRKQGLYLHNVNGTVNLTGTADITGAMYASEGTVVIGDGINAARVEVNRVEFGDTQSGSNASILTIKANATLHVKAGDVAKAYSSTGILLGEWEGSSTANIYGNLYAENATAYVGDKQVTYNIENGGVMAVKGIGVNEEKSGKSETINLNLKDGGKLVLGANGISSNKTFNAEFGHAEVGMTADTTLAKAITLTSAEGTTFNTTKYKWVGEGSQLTLGTDTAGGTMTVSGNLSGTGKLIANGAGTLVLSGTNTHTGGTVVNGGTLKAASAGALGSGDVTVNAGALELTTAITTTGNIILGNNSTLVLAGENMLTAGSLALVGGVTDLTINLNSIVPSEARTYTLATGTNGAADLTGVNVNLVWETKPAYFTTEGVKQEGNSWVITLETEGRELTWNGSEGIWSSTEPMWHTATEQDLVFLSGDSAVFETSVDPAFAMLAEAVNAQKVTVQSGAAVGIAASFGAQEASLSASVMDISGTLSTSVAVNAVEVVAHGENAAWNIGTNSTVTAGSLTVDSGSTLAVSGEGTLTAGTISGNGTIKFSEGFQLAGDTAITVNDGNVLTLSGAAAKTVSLSNLNLAGTLVLQDGYHLTVSGQLAPGTAGQTVNIRNNAKLTVSLSNADNILNMDAASSGDLYLNSGYISYRSGLGNQTLHMANGTQLWFGAKPGSTADAAKFTNNIVLDGNATVRVYGSSNHSSVTISGNVEGADHTLTKNDGDQVVAFTGNVTLGGLTTDNNGGGIIQFAGGEGSVGNVVTNGSTKIQFSASSAPGAKNEYTFNTFNMSPGNAGNTRWLIVDSGVTVRGTGSNLGDDHKATIHSAWGVNGGGLEVNGTLFTEGVIGMEADNKTAYIKGSGTINAAGLNLSNGSTTYIQDGITINITTSQGVYVRNDSAAAASVHLKNATLQAKDSDWAWANSSSVTVTLDDTTTGTTFDVAADRTITISKVLGGEGKLVKTGEGTLTINGAQDYTGGTVVKGGRLVVNGSIAAGSTISVEGDATIGGNVDSTQVGIASNKTATFENGIIAADGISFSEDAQVTNRAEQSAMYGIDKADMSVVADSLVVEAEKEATVRNEVRLEDVTVGTFGTLTLDNVPEAQLELETMTIEAGAFVSVYTSDAHTTEATVVISDTLTAGAGTLYANLTLKDGSTLDLSIDGYVVALTLGSELTVAPEGGLINLDADTIAALEALDVNDHLDLVSAAFQTELTYGGNYDGMWFGQLFERTDGVLGDYLVYANDTAFGLTKVSKTPEPTTGTLSLLALAALAARRRRK